MKKYKVNEIFFDSWSVEMGWVLGLYLGDGCVYGNAVNIGMIDKDVIEKVKLALNAEYPIRITNREGKKTYYEFTITNKNFAESIIKKGVIPRKSKIIQLPEIPTNYFSHFTRGLFDANGTVVISGRPKSRRIITSFSTSSDDFAIQLKEALISYGFIKTQSYLQRHEKFGGGGYPGHSWRIVCWDTNFLPWVYQDKGIWYMERKFTRYQELLNKLST